MLRARFDGLQGPTRLQWCKGPGRTGLRMILRGPDQAGIEQVLRRFASAALSRDLSVGESPLLLTARHCSETWSSDKQPQALSVQRA